MVIGNCNRVIKFMLCTLNYKQYLGYDESISITSQPNTMELKTAKSHSGRYSFYLTKYCWSILLNRKTNIRQALVLFNWKRFSQLLTISLLSLTESSRSHCCKTSSREIKFIPRQAVTRRAKLNSRVSCRSVQNSTQF